MQGKDEEWVTDSDVWDGGGGSSPYVCSLMSAYIHWRAMHASCLYMWFCEHVQPFGLDVWTLHEPWQRIPSHVDCSGIVPCCSHHAMVAVIADSGDWEEPTCYWTSMEPVIYFILFIKRGALALEVKHFTDGFQCVAEFHLVCVWNQSVLCHATSLGEVPSLSWPYVDKDRCWF